MVSTDDRGAVAAPDWGTTLNRSLVEPPDGGILAVEPRGAVGASGGDSDGGTGIGGGDR